MEIFRKIKRSSNMLARQLFQSDDAFDPFMDAEDYDDQDNDLQESSDEDKPSESQSQLIPLKEKPSLSAYLSQYWHSSYFINRLAWWGIKYQSEVDADLLQNKNSTRLFWLKGEGIPLENWSKIQRANRIKNFIDSANFVLSDAGSAIMAALLLHDLISYGLFPEERCGTSFPSILVGTAMNQITWMNHFGSDVIHEAAYWTWLGIILIPPMVGLSFLFLRNQQLGILNNQSHNMEVAFLANLDKETLTFKQALLSLFPMSRLSRTLTQVKCMLLWDGRKDDDQKLLISLHFKRTLINTLIELVESNYFLIRYQAMQLLTQIAASFHPENLDRFIDDQTHKADLVQLRTTILTTLRKDPINEASTRRTLAELEAACAHPLPFEDMEDAVLLEDRQRGGMARYFRWTLGDDTRPSTQLFWIPSLLISTFKFYSISLYLELIVKKLMDIAYYFHDKSVCENNGNYFKFLMLSERYECVACDWPFVSYQNSLTAQACLESLFQQRQTPKELRHYLNELPVVRGISRVDLSQYDWSNWSALDWEKLLLALEPMFVSPLELFNISGISEGVTRAPTEQHLQALVQLLTQINMTQFDMSHYRLTDELFRVLLDSLPYPSLSGLYLQDTNMTDSSAIYLSELIANNGFNLTELYLADNQIADKGIIQISQIVSNSSLQVLNVAHNLFSDLGLQQLGLGIQQGILQGLDLSDQSFSANGLRLFSDALKGNTSLSRLKLNNIGLTRDHLIALQSCLENIEFLDISANLLGSQTIQSILNFCKQNLKVLISQNNDLGEEAGSFIAEKLSATSIEYLDLSKNFLGAGFNDLIRALPNSQILSLICEECDLKDADVAELSLIFANDTLLLQSLNLNNNKISNQTLFNCLEELPKGSLRELHLNKNEISCAKQNTSVLAQGLAQTNLTVLDLGNNQLDHNFFNELAPLLPQSSLQQLSLSGNKLEAASIKHFSAALVQLPCHTQDLNAASLSRQEKRVFYPVKSNTALNRLDIIKTDTDNATLRGFCRVSASLPHVQFLEPDHLQRLNWQSCDVLTANSNGFRLEQTANQTQSVRSAALIMSSPFLISLLCAGGILCLVALLYGTYRASRSTYRFFRPAPTIDRTESEENITQSNLHRSFL